MQNRTNHIANLLAELRTEMRQLIGQGGDWEAFGLKVFRFQCAHNPVYGEFVRLRGVDPEVVKSTSEVPFLPVAFFQSHWVSVFEDGTSMERVFESSGTTGQQRSRHPIDSLAWYDEVAMAGFEHCVGAFEGRKIIALLPGYRQESSLIYMVQSFMRRCGQTSNAEWFFMEDWVALGNKLRTAVQGGETALVIGVTHALLKWSEAAEMEKPYPNVQLLETGGMKGHGPERIREEVHAALRPLVATSEIGSEYGMTELLSQAWSLRHGRFVTPPWMQVRLSSMSDPGAWAQDGKQGRIRIMDLANLASCAFLETSDIGRMHPDGAFEVLGRFDHAEVRGCNLLTVEG
ncbi:MAG: acyl transferase [Flavobacteriales bacterium]|nr:acyl transferase [Flavobacteriales bacterium]